MSKFHYHSEQVRKVNNKTRRNIVNIENGKGTKSFIEYSPQGKILKENTKPLTQHEVANIRNYRFMPNLFHNVQPSLRSKGRRTRRR